MKKELLTFMEKESKMTAKDYIDLANLSKDILDARRRIEWKASFAFWAGIVSISVFLLKAGYSKANLGSFCYLGLVIGGSLAAVAFTYWLIYVNGSHRKDINLIQYWREKADPEFSRHLKACSKLKNNGSNCCNKLKAFCNKLKTLIGCKCNNSNHNYKPERNLKLIETNAFCCSLTRPTCFLPHSLITAMVILIFMGSLHIPQKKEILFTGTHKFNDGPIAGAIGSFNSAKKNLFCNHLEGLYVTADGKVVTAELIPSTLTEESSNLCFYRLDTEKKEYNWVPQEQ